MTTTQKNTASTTPYDPVDARSDFPILHTRVHGKPLVYLDNAATAQKPQAVLDRLTHYYAAENANIHRGVHHLSDMATQEYEAARIKVRNLLHARNEREIVFVRGATEGINLVASSFGRANLHKGDEIIITHMEHHSNIVPWQLLCQEKGAKLLVAPITDEGEMRIDEFEKLLSPRTKLVSVVHMSNSLGTINPVRRIVRLAHAAGAKVLLDGAQAISHMPVDVQDLDCDFYVFSGHKLYGPTGIGVLYGRAELLDAMPPYQGGGDMIRTVSLAHSTYNDLPYKFEAGTPNIAGAVGLGAAIDYVNGLGLERIADHEVRLLTYGTERLQAVAGLKLIGTAREKASILAFTMANAHPHDIGTVLDREGVAIRTGHHCTQPLMERLGVPATARASLGLYNTESEIDALADGLSKVKTILG